MCDDTNKKIIIFQYYVEFNVLKYRKNWLPVRFKHPKVEKFEHCWNFKAKLAPSFFIFDQFDIIQYLLYNKWPNYGKSTISKYKIIHNFFKLLIFWTKCSFNSKWHRVRESVWSICMCTRIYTFYCIVPLWFARTLQA